MNNMAVGNKPGKLRSCKTGDGFHETSGRAHGFGSRWFSQTSDDVTPLVAVAVAVAVAGDAVMPLVAGE